MSLTTAATTVSRRAQAELKADRTPADGTSQEGVATTHRSGELGRRTAYPSPGHRTSDPVTPGAAENTTGGPR